MSVLYITQDGITDHIGRSQIAPYLLGLARLGHKIHLISAEKEGRDLLIDRYQREFDAVGVSWEIVPYKNKPRYFAQILTQKRLEFAVKKALDSKKIDVVHCRSYPPALIAVKYKKKYGFKFLFDVRDFYADDGLVTARGLGKLIYRWIKYKEKSLVLSADKIICLTHRAVDILGDWYFSGEKNILTRFQVIPCCADFQHFDYSKVNEDTRQSFAKRVGVEVDGFVVLYLGSLGPDYLLPEMLSLFRQVLISRPDAIFLFVSNNGKDLVERECLLQGVDLSRIRFISADRDEIPALISLARFSVVFIRADISKAGCSPTKLAELFACNVPVIANTGVGDLDEIIKPEVNGSFIVKNFEEQTLKEAVEAIISKNIEGDFIRKNSLCFSTEAGVELYSSVYQELLN